MKLRLLLFALFLAFQQHGSSADVLSMLGIKKTFQVQMMTAFVNTQVDMRVKKILDGVSNKTCAAHLKEYVQGIRNLKIWAIKMLDASTKIPLSYLEGVDVSFGNWYECNQVRDISTKHGSFSAKHCLVRACAAGMGKCLKTNSYTASSWASIQRQIKASGGVANVGDVGLQLQGMTETAMGRVSLCLPSTCSSQDLETALNRGLEELTIPVVINIDDTECQSTEGQPLNFVDKIAILILVLIFTLVVCSTIYDVVYQDTAERKGLFLTFSAYTNMRRVMETHSDATTLHCVHGVRAISILWFIFGQRYLSDANITLINKMDVMDFASSAHNLVITLMPMCVDTFLVLSGLLLSYKFLNNIVERNSFDAKHFYLHRYIRLIPSLAMMVLLQSSLLTKVGDGPMWGIKQNVDCATTWWHSLFFIKNYKMPSTCAEETWYVALDTQLYCLSPLLLLALWKTPRRSRQLLAIVIGLSWLVPFIQSYSLNLIVPFQYSAPENEFNRALEILFYPTHNRATAWLVGLFLGYLLHRMKVGQYKLRLNKVMVAVMWTTTFLLLLACAKIVHWCLQIDNEPSRLRQAFFNASIHLLWAVAVALLIFACLTGHGGPINGFLSLEMWQPISRLSYCMYLVHGAVQLHDVARAKTLEYFAHVAQLPKANADIALCILAATLLTLMFELPALSLERYFRRDKTGYSINNRVLVAEIEKYQPLTDKEKEIIRP